MILPLIFRWFSHIRKHPIQKPGKGRPIYLLSLSDSNANVSPLFSEYFADIRTAKTLNDFSLLDILLGRFRFAGHPDRKNLGLTGKIKRALIRSCYTNYQKLADVLNLADIMFSKAPRASLLVPSAHVVDIYRTHFTHFDVRELSAYLSPRRNALINLLSKYSKSLVDTEPGITVFVNMASPALLAAYKRLHPNRTIYLHIHDGLTHMAEENRFEAFRKQLASLLSSGLIDGASSYNRQDAEFLGINWQPSGVNGDVMHHSIPMYRKYLYTFVGAYKSQSDMSRLNDLAPVKNHLLATRPGCERHLKEYLIFVENFASERITYDQYLALMGETEVFVDMYRIAPDEGLSFRIAEALLSGKKVITNRSDILNYDFYDPSRFFLIGHDPIERLDAFLTGEFLPLPDDIRKRYDCRYWWGFDPDKN